MTQQNQALVPQLIFERGNKILDNIGSVAAGVVAISLLAQLTITLPWTPVPITGQTFGVAVVSLMWGRARAVMTTLSYLSLGALGLPVFAFAKSGFSVGPTMGYLLGMVVASYWMGSLADQGWTKTFWRSWLAAFSGSLIVFSCGVYVLSYFIPKENLFIAGVLPFLPGDIIKTLLASFLVFRSNNLLTKEKI